MARNLAPAMITAIQEKTGQPFLLVKIETDAGDVRVWSGLGNLTSNSELYIGTGKLGTISPLQ
ncbi:MAG: hypothetical protein IID18_09900, partial [Nitrospinae bacterium]|nr:hypothetical protein [Nitrospinota bacterium]